MIELPTRILTKAFVQLNISLWEGEPVMLGQCVMTLNEYHLAQVQHMIVLRILVAFSVTLVSSSVKIDSSLLVIGSLVKQEPAAQVGEAVSLERKLNGTLTAKLAHKLVNRA